MPDYGANASSAASVEGMMSVEDTDIKTSQEEVIFFLSFMCSFIISSHLLSIWQPTRAVPNHWAACACRADCTLDGHHV